MPIRKRNASFLFLIETKEKAATRKRGRLSLLDYEAGRGLRINFIIPIFTQSQFWREVVGRETVLTPAGNSDAFEACIVDLLFVPVGFAAWTEHLDCA
jgi:hypothetical protein